MKKISIMIVTCCLMAFLSMPSWATPVDMRTFDVCDSTISVSTDGSFAIFSEDPSLFSVSLKKTSFHISSNSTNLALKYDLQVPDGNEDYFHTYLAGLDGFPLAGFEFICGGITGTYSGTINWSLENTSILGSDVSFVFEFAAGFDDSGFESSLKVSDVSLTIHSGPSPVPEASTVLFLVCGFSGLLFLNIRKYIK